MDLSLKLATNDQYTAIYSIMALAGEHMHRALGLSHWHPFPASDYFINHFEGKEVFTVYEGNLLVGTFNISTQPEPYYLADMSAYWSRFDIETMYFSAFALLPSYQQRGVGSWCMMQMDQMVQERGFQQVRFDAVNTHSKLKGFYRKNGYHERGILDLGRAQVMCFEKIFVS
ncbi:MAG: GNAT family N-acetyltransferase [Phototrophicaceae bacterium]